MMSKKVIQVPVDEDLLGALDEASRSEKRKRADLIREACREYLKRRRTDMLDRVYQEGYERVPEDSALGEAQVALFGAIFGDEVW
jgi:metal-responsive CopG/Arc/MetJ family transcriptional regulator